MKQLTNFSRIAIIGYSLYFIFSIVLYHFITQIPRLLTASLSIAYAASFIAVATWIISHDNTLKKPATFIIIASALSIANQLVSIYYQGKLTEANVTEYSLITGGIYTLHLIFTCIGFFKLAKGLPKGTLARHMAKLVPWTALAALIISSVFAIVMVYMTIPSAVLRSPNRITFLAEILAMTLLCYSLPKAIEIRRTIIAED